MVFLVIERFSANWHSSVDFLFCLKGSPSDTLSQRDKKLAVACRHQGMCSQAALRFTNRVQLKWERWNNVMWKIISGKGRYHTAVDLLKIGFLPGTLHVCSNMWFLGSRWGRGVLALETTRYGYFSAAVTVLGSPAVLPCSSAAAFHGSSEALANQHFYMNVVRDIHQKLWFPDKHLFA